MQIVLIRFKDQIPSITIDSFLIFFRNTLIDNFITLQRFQRLTILLLDDFNEFGTTRFNDSFKRQGFSVEVFSILGKISTRKGWGWLRRMCRRCGEFRQDDVLS